MERLEQLVDAEAARGDYILEAAQDNIDGFAQALDQQAHRHQRSRQAELQRQRQGLTRAAAQELVNERRQRMTALKEASCEPRVCCFVCCCRWAGRRRRGDLWGWFDWVCAGVAPGDCCPQRGIAGLITAVVCSSGGWLGGVGGEGEGWFLG